MASPLGDSSFEANAVFSVTPAPRGPSNTSVSWAEAVGDSPIPGTTTDSAAAATEAMPLQPQDTLHEAHSAPTTPAAAAVLEHALPVGGRLQFCREEWKRLTDNQWVLQIIMEGLTFELLHLPRQFRRPPPRAFDAAALQVISQEIEALLHKRAILPIEDDGNGFYSAVFVVPKRGGKFRPVWDFRHLNSFLVYRHFKMEGMHTVRDLLQPGDWFIKIDLTDGYLHIPVHPQFQPLLRFSFQRRHFQMTTMGFGLSCAPRVFTKVIKVVVKELRRRGLRLAVYLDDFLLLSRTEAEARAQRDVTIDLLFKLGFGINQEKSMLQPAQRVVFLGMELVSTDMLICVPSDKLKEVHSCIRSAISAKALSARQLASLLGRLAQLAPAVAPTRLKLRAALQDKHRALLASSHNWDAVTTLSAETLQELQWWLNEIFDWNGRAIIPQPHEVVLETDASESGWGAFLQPDRQALGSWSIEERERSNNYRELRAVELAVEAFLPHLHGKRVQVATDNTATMAYINHMGGRTRELSVVAERLWRLCLTAGIQLAAVFLPGVQNTRADALSRFHDRSDWQLNPELFSELDRLWGPHDVDMFASRLNCQVRRFFSWRADPAAEAVDAFNQQWSGFNGYANPPFALIGMVLSKVMREHATITLVAPVWEGAPWWPDLQRLSVDTPRLLPDRHDLFLPGFLGNELPLANPTWRVAAWRISGERSAASASSPTLQPTSFQDLGR